MRINVDTNNTHVVPAVCFGSGKSISQLLKLGNGFAMEVFHSTVEPPETEK